MNVSGLRKSALNHNTVYNSIPQRQRETDVRREGEVGMAGGGERRITYFFFSEFLLVFRTFSRVVSRCMGVVWPLLADFSGFVQSCFHAFSLDCFNGSK